MRFLVDAHLPPALCALLSDAGHAAIHASQLPAQNRTSDQVINDLSLAEQRVVISKDTDFYYSHLPHQKPRKPVLVRTGNIGTRELKVLFARDLAPIIQAPNHNSLIELDRQAVRVLG